MCVCVCVCFCLFVVLFFGLFSLINKSVLVCKRDFYIQWTSAVNQRLCLSVINGITSIFCESLFWL